MSTTHPRFKPRIDGSPEAILDLIADIRITVASCPLQKRHSGKARGQGCRLNGIGASWTQAMSRRMNTAWLMGFDC